MLNVNNYQFIIGINGDIYWKCHHVKKSSCPASITTVGLSSTIRSSNLYQVGHSAESVVNLIIMKRVDNYKKRA